MCQETITECGVCGTIIATHVEQCYEEECSGVEISTVYTTCNDCDN